MGRKVEVRSRKTWIAEDGKQHAREQLECGHWIEDLPAIRAKRNAHRICKECPDEHAQVLYKQRMARAARRL